MLVGQDQNAPIFEMKIDTKKVLISDHRPADQLCQMI
jgi:hypothetical protein